MKFAKKHPDYNGISIILPAFNEKANIRHAVFDILDYMNRLEIAFEIIVVDDGSCDGMFDVVKAVSDANERVKCVRHPKNEGYGRAIRDGIRASNFDLVFFTDSDRQFDIKGLDIMLPLMYTGAVDVIVGYRLDRKDPRIRKFLSWGFNTLAGFLFDLNVKDIDCAFKLFRKDIFRKIEIESSNFFVNTEILAKARFLGLEILEVGVAHFPRAAGKSTVSFKYIPITLRELYRIRKELQKMKKSLI